MMNNFHNNAYYWSESNRRWTRQTKINQFLALRLVWNIKRIHDGDPTFIMKQQFLQNELSLLLEDNMLCMSTVTDYSNETLLFTRSSPVIFFIRK